MSAFETKARKRLTDQQRAKLFLDRGGKCHNCTRVIRAGEEWVAEHLQSLSTGGGNEPENWGLTCCNCLPAKNAADAKIAAKARHVATAHLVPTSQRQKLGRPMPGTKASGLRKRMSGEVERR
jgi:5-methylcytosine-specific restriction enzyme A